MCALFLKTNRKPECGTLSWGTCETNITAHQSDKTLHDGKPQPRPFVSPRDRSIPLGEGIKDRLLRLDRNADSGITHRHFEEGAIMTILNTFNVNQDATSFRKLDGIAHEVHQNLPQPDSVSPPHGGEFGVDLAF